MNPTYTLSLFRSRCIQRRVSQACCSGRITRRRPTCHALRQTDCRNRFWLGLYTCKTRLLPACSFFLRALVAATSWGDRHTYKPGRGPLMRCFLRRGTAWKEAQLSVLSGAKFLLAGRWWNHAPSAGFLAFNRSIAHLLHWPERVVCLQGRSAVGAAPKRGFCVCSCVSSAYCVQSLRKQAVAIVFGPWMRLSPSKRRSVRSWFYQKVRIMHPGKVSGSMNGQQGSGTGSEVFCAWLWSCRAVGSSVLSLFRVRASGVFQQALNVGVAPLVVAG